MANLLQSGAKSWSHKSEYKIMLRRVSKVPQEISCGPLPDPRQSGVCEV